MGRTDSEEHDRELRERIIKGKPRQIKESKSKRSANRTEAG